MIQQKSSYIKQKIIEEIKMFGTKWWWYLHNTVNILNATELHIFSLNGEFYVNFTTIKWKSTNQKGLLLWQHAS